MVYSCWIVCVIILQVGFIRAQNERYRCDLGGEFTRQRDVYHLGQVRRVTLQESGRIQHKLINAVLGILLTEKLGYKDVTTVPEVGENLTAILSPLSVDTQYDWPEALINAEIYVPPEYSFKKYVSSAGKTGTRGDGYRWYLHSPQPLNTTRCALAKYLKSYAYPALIDDCYGGTEFLNSSDSLFNQYEKNNNENYTDYRSIVVLSTYMNKTSFLKKHVEDLKINASVIWLEHKLNAVVDELIKSRNKTFFIVDNIDWPQFTEMEPNYENHLNTSSSLYENLPYTKVNSNFVHYYAPRIFIMIKTFKLTKPEINSLMKEYRNQALNRSERAIENAACSWLKSESNAAKIERLASVKVPQILLYVLTCEEELSHKVLGRVAHQTRDYINSTKILNGTYELELTNINVTCYAAGLARTVKIFIDILTGTDYRKLGGIVLPAIPQALDIVAGLSRPFETSVFTFNSDGPSFANRKQYPNVLRMVGEKINLKKAYLELCRQYGWSRVAAVSGYNQNNVDFISFLGQHLSANGVKFTFEKIDKSFVWKALESLKHQNARIIIVDVDLSLGKELLLMAYELRMLPTEGYVWILPDWVPSLYAGLETSMKDDVENIKQVLHGHLSLTFSSINDPRNNDKSDRIASFRQDLLDQRNKEHTNDYSHAGFVADAIWTFALSIKLFIEEHSGAEDDIHGNVKNITSYIENQDPFDGVSGKIEFYNGSMRASCIELKQWNKETNGSTINLIAKITLKANENVTNWKEITNPVWRTPYNRIPGDGSSRCYFQQNSNDFFVSCNDPIIFGSIGFILFIITVFVLFTAFSLKLHNVNINKLKSAVKKFKSYTNRLPNHEVSRENIKIKCEIGKGSFGKVFDGYLKIYEEPRKVAIKHLKCDATAEDENEFLHEANTMASFKHKNIVKLMAVCTVGTPILIVMELMSLGDLKTFLFTKRHLLNSPEGTLLMSNSPDSDIKSMISPKGLTTMAHNVASALSYLASKHFVHRDVAGRNCLVNSRGVVKLGDFGMTRYVFSKGEYLTNRRTIFPIRWMAPESLNPNHSSFTTMSDMWSYGILLYEIVTFGCRPYNHIKNCLYVKDFVLNGNIIPLPSAVHKELKFKIEQCWSYDSSQRPTAAKMLDYLAEQPTLLHPCLEVEELPDRRVTMVSSADTDDSLSNMSLLAQFGSADTTDTPPVLPGRQCGHAEPFLVGSADMADTPPILVGSADKTDTPSTGSDTADTSTRAFFH